MTKTIKSSVPGNKGLAMVATRNNGSYGPAEAFIYRTGATEHSPTGIVYTQSEAYQFILTIAEAAGLRFEPTAAGTGIILQEPEDSKVVQRRDNVAVEYFDTSYRYLETDQKSIVARVVELEQKAGEL